MNKSRDWMPGTRRGQLQMAQKWGQIIGAKTAEWGLPQTLLQSFGTLVVAASAALAEAEDAATRTQVTNERCREAFDALKKEMRRVKNKYFQYGDPLTGEDYIELELHVPDTARTPGAAPSAQARADPFLTGPHEIGFRIVIVSGEAGGAVTSGFRVYTLIRGQGEDAPGGPGGFSDSFFTKRAKEVMPLPYDSSGKRIYFIVQIENGGKKGPWGPVSSALIP
jgi:hypothetical protein